MLGNAIRSLLFWKFFSKNLAIGLSLLMLFVAAITVDSTQLLKRGPESASAQEYEYFGSEEYPADYQSTYEPSGSGYEYYSYSSESTNSYVNNDSSSYNSGYEYVSSTPYDSSYSSDYSSYSSSNDYQYYGSQPYDNYTSNNYEYVSSVPYENSSSGYEYVSSQSYDTNSSSGYDYVSSTPYESPSSGYDYVNSTPYSSSPSYTEGPGCNGTHAVWGKWNGSQLIEVEADYGETGECGYSSSGYSSSGTTYSGNSSSASSGSWQFVYPECDWSSGQVYDVYWHSGTGSYDRRNYHYQDGVCGNTRSSGSTGSTQSQSGSWQFVYPECDWNSGQVYDVYWHSGTGAYERRNPHYQEDACGRNREWEGPGCNGNRSVWGIWDSSNTQRLIRVERDYGVVPGECNNPYPTATPYPVATSRPVTTQVNQGRAQVTSQDRQECYGRHLVMTRYFSDNSSPIIVSDYGERVGYCGVQASLVQQPAYSAPQPVYSAPVQQPVYTAPAPQPVYTAPQQTLTPIQGACTVDTTSVTRGQSVTYTAYVSTGGTGRVGRADFRGERSQSSGNPNFTVRYDTSGTKYMTVNITDADPRGGSQLVECPWVTVYDPVVLGAQSTGSYPVYTQQPTVIYQNNPVPAPNTQPVYTGSPSEPYVAPAQNTDYCPAGYTQQISGGYVYCIAQQPSGSTAPAATSAPSTSSINCPSGYTAQAYGTSVYCVAQSAGAPASTTAPTTTVVPTQSQPQVVAKTADTVGELPRTGFPLAAWGISALLPLGLKLRKGKKVNDEQSANSIWTIRELQKEN